MSEMQQSAFISVGSHHRPAAQEAATPSPAVEQEEALTPVPAIDINGSLPAVPDNYFCIVMASQVSEHNAQLFLSQLAEQGFSDARILVSGGKKIRRVVYGSYETEADAVSSLRQLRSESRIFRDTWIMEVK